MSPGNRHLSAIATLRPYTPQLSDDALQLKRLADLRAHMLKMAVSFALSGKPNELWQDRAREAAKITGLPIAEVIHTIKEQERRRS